MRILLAASLFICQIAVAQIPVTYPSFGRGDPAFKNALIGVAGPTPPPAESEWLPYSAILVNHTPGKTLPKLLPRFSGSVGQDFQSACWFANEQAD
jgi:hypothetical protein